MALTTKKINTMFQGSLFEENYLIRTLGALVHYPEIALTDSHQPTHRQKLQKSMSLPTLTDKPTDEKEHRSDDIGLAKKGGKVLL